jgi:hypothetical protein
MCLKLKRVEMHTNVWYESQEEDLDVHIRITLKWMLKSKIGSCEIDKTPSAQQQWQAVVKNSISVE